VVTYYVFEHVVDLNHLLSQCRRVLRQDGKLVIEVPDIAYYPVFVDAVALHEHVNHFSVRSLCSVVCQHGFRMQAVSRKHASRNFGFVAAFKKDAPVARWAPWEAADAAACLEAGHRLLLRKWENLGRLGQHLVRWAASGERIVMWCANQVSRDVLQGLALPGAFVLVDSNLEKRGFVDGYTARHPDECASDIVAADRFVIFSPDAARAILDQIKHRYRHSWDGLTVVIADSSSPDGYIQLTGE